MISGFSTSLVANLLPGCHHWPPTVCTRTPLPLLVRQNAGEKKIYHQQFIPPLLSTPLLLRYTVIAENLLQLGATFFPLSFCCI